MVAACTPAPTVYSPAVPPELKHSWEVAFNRGDAAAVAALYTADAQLMMSGSEPIKGPRDIQQTVQGMIDSGLKVQIGATSNVGSGEIAYVSGTYEVRQGAEGPETEHGGFVEVWRRQNDEWRIVLDVNAAGVGK